MRHAFFSLCLWASRYVLAECGPLKALLRSMPSMVGFEPSTRVRPEPPSANHPRSHSHSLDHATNPAAGQGLWRASSFPCCRPSPLQLLLPIPMCLRSPDFHRCRSTKPRAACDLRAPLVTSAHLRPMWFSADQDKFLLPSRRHHSPPLASSRPTAPLPLRSVCLLEGSSTSHIHRSLSYTDSFFLARIVSLGPTPSFPSLVAGPTRGSCRRPQRISMESRPQ